MHGGKPYMLCMQTDNSGCLYTSGYQMLLTPCQWGKQIMPTIAAGRVTLPSPNLSDPYYLFSISINSFNAFNVPFLGSEVKLSFHGRKYF